jgi:hypothetical protein
MRRIVTDSTGPRLAGSLLLLAIACGGSGSAATGPGGGPIPAELAGSWNIATASQGQVCDPLTGACQSAFGGSETFRFTADGHFTYTRHLESAFGGCLEKADLYLAGTMTADATSLTLLTRQAVGKNDDGCGHTKTESYTVAPAFYTWLVRDNGTNGRELLLTDGGGDVEGPYTLTGGA